MAGCWNFFISQSLGTIMFFMSVCLLSPTLISINPVTTSTLLLQGGSVCLLSPTLISINPVTTSTLLLQGGSVCLLSPTLISINPVTTSTLLLQGGSVCLLSPTLISINPVTTSTLLLQGGSVCLLSPTLISINPVTTSTLLLQGGIFDVTSLAVKLGSMIALLGIVSHTDWYHSLSQCYHTHMHLILVGSCGVGCDCVICAEETIFLP